MKRYRVGELHENGEGIGKYNMISSDSRGARAIGYCAGAPVTTREEYEEKFRGHAPDDWEDEDDWKVENAKRTLRVNREKVERFGDKYHEEPHDTEEEAKECYSQYCLDVKFATYKDEDTELLDYHGVRPDMLSEPIEGDEVPADVKGRECEEPDCETIVAHPTAEIVVFGTNTRYHLCSEHCDKETFREFWTCPTSGMST